MFAFSSVQVWVFALSCLSFRPFVFELSLSRAYAYARGHEWNEKLVISSQKEVKEVYAVWLLDAYKCDESCDEGDILVTKWRNTQIYD